MEPCVSGVQYYRQRANEERELAKGAGRADVAAIHDELARQYDALVNRAELRPTLRLAFPPGLMATLLRFPILLGRPLFNPSG